MTRSADLIRNGSTTKTRPRQEMRQPSPEGTTDNNPVASAPGIHAITILSAEGTADPFERSANPSPSPSDPNSAFTFVIN